MNSIYTKQDNLALISSVVKKIEKKSLLSKVIWSAITYIKDNPRCSVKEAFDFAIKEWE